MKKVSDCESLVEARLKQLSWNLVQKISVDKSVVEPKSTREPTRRHSSTKKVTETESTITVEFPPVPAIIAAGVQPTKSSHRSHVAKVKFLAWMNIVIEILV